MMGYDWHSVCAGRPAARRRRLLFFFVDAPQPHQFEPIEVEHGVRTGEYTVLSECLHCGQRKEEHWLALGDLIERDIPDPEEEGLFAIPTVIRGRSRREEAE